MHPVKKIFLKLDQSIASIILCILVTTTILQIFCRFLLNRPLQGTDEFAQYALICVTFFGAPVVTKQSSQIGMSELRNLMPPIIRRSISLLIEMLAFVTFSLITVSVALTIMRNLNTITITLQMPFWVLFFPTLSGYFLLALCYIPRTMRAWRVLVGKEEEVIDSAYDDKGE